MSVIGRIQSMKFNPLEVESFQNQIIFRFISKLFRDSLYVKWKFVSVIIQVWEQ